MKRIILLFFVFLFTVSVKINAQVVYEHITNENIYDFLDEMANEKIIILNSAMKPYSRNLIAQKLLEVKDHEEQLNHRQKKELDFYLQGFQTEMDFPMKFDKRFNLLNKYNRWALTINPLGAYYKDSMFTLWIKPILGYEYSNNENGGFTHSWGGAEIAGYIGKHIGFYTSLRDNNESRLMIDPEYFIQKPGVPVKKFASDDIDYSEARGGLTFSWKWGHVGIIKDHLQWGSNYFGANILSGRTPSYGMIKLHLNPVKWFQFDYFHGWLVSSVVDSSESYWDGDSYRTVFHPKYMAANMFTFMPWKGLHLSFGNSIVYSDIPVQAVYFIPFLFFKSVDHTLNATYHYGDAGQNSQMFVNISSRNLKHTHLYFSWFIDEMSLRYMFDKDMQSNLWSIKIGGKVSDWPFNNIWISMEYTMSRPLVYQNYLSTVTFTSNLYNMGHYLRDNSDIYNIGFGFKPVRGLHFVMKYSSARHGDDFDYATIPTNRGLKFMEHVMWKQQIMVLSIKYEIVNNAYFYLNYKYSNVSGDQSYVEKYTPSYYRGKTNTFTFGANIGF
jgi:hypothetical protein